MMASYCRATMLDAAEGGYVRSNEALCVVGEAEVHLYNAHGQWIHGSLCTSYTCGYLCPYDNGTYRVVKEGARLLCVAKRSSSHIDPHRSRSPPHCLDSVHSTVFCCPTQPATLLAPSCVAISFYCVLCVACCMLPPPLVFSSILISDIRLRVVLRGWLFWDFCVAFISDLHSMKY